jgi:hypothetical protein
MYLDCKVSDAPFKGFLVRVEEDIETVSSNGTASVEYLHGLIIPIIGYDHFGPKSVLRIGRHEGIACTYSVPARRLAVCIFATTF